jgi:hypothetical protein
MVKPETLKRAWLVEDERKIDAALCALFEHEHGRRLLWWILELGKVNHQPFTGNALTTAFNCGEMNVGQRFLERLLLVSPQGYVKMMQEMADVRKQRDEQLLGADIGDESDHRDESADGE